MKAYKKVGICASWRVWQQSESRQEVQPEDLHRENLKVK